MSASREADALMWLGYALSDLAAARSQPGRHVWPRIVAFHAQQAAEKALKAALALSGVESRKTIVRAATRPLVCGVWNVGDITCSLMITSGHGSDADFVDRGADAPAAR